MWTEKRERVRVQGNDEENTDNARKKFLRALFFMVIWKQNRPRRACADMLQGTFRLCLHLFSFAHLIGLYAWTITARPNRQLGLRKKISLLKG